MAAGLPLPGYREVVAQRARPRAAVHRRGRPSRATRPSAAPGRSRQEAEKAAALALLEREGAA